MTLILTVFDIFSIRRNRLRRSRQPIDRTQKPYAYYSTFVKTRTVKKTRKAVNHSYFPRINFKSAFVKSRLKHLYFSLKIANTRRFADETHRPPSHLYATRSHSR